MDYATQLKERRLLVERSNRLIEKHCLPVPRFFSSRFINFEFWSCIFARIFGIKCNASIRTHFERVQMLKSCLNTLESLMGESLDHIRAECLLNFDVVSMKNLLQIAELWDDSFDLENESSNMQNSSNDQIVTNENSRTVRPNAYGSVSVNVLATIDEKQHSKKSHELADVLYKSLKNQILAMEIEKKIKLYLGDVTVAKPESDNLRAPRQSIVRTRAIQPMCTSTFDFTLKKVPQRNHVLSVDLEKLFPELSKSPEIIERIRQQEQRMLMSQRSIRIWQESLAMNKVNKAFNKIIAKQRETVALAEKEEKEEERVAKAKKERAQQIALKHSLHQVRAQKALLQKEIDNFYHESTAAYLNARSHLERILMMEFKKVDAYKKQEINEIRKYLQNDYETETDNLRTLLEHFDSL